MVIERKMLNNQFNLYTLYLKRKNQRKKEVKVIKAIWEDWNASRSSQNKGSRSAMIVSLLQPWEILKMYTRYTYTIQSFLFFLILSWSQTRKKEPWEEDGHVSMSRVSKPGGDNGGIAAWEESAISNTFLEAAWYLLVLDGKKWDPLSLATEKLRLCRFCSAGDKTFSFECACWADAIAELKTPDSLKLSIMAYGRSWMQIVKLITRQTRSSSS